MRTSFFAPLRDHPRPWARSHAALPFARSLDEGRLRVYFSTRDADNRSQVAACTLDLVRSAVVEFDEEPLLAPGALGGFDDSGCTMSSLVEHEGRTLLYYTGWSLGRTVPFYLFAGVAISSDGGRSFERRRAPLLPRSEVDPFLTASPYVLRDGDLLRMYYVSATGWEVRAEGPRHRYHLRYAESRDGLSWERAGHVCLDFADASEYAFGRPCVLADERGYRMWFCVRGETYRLGYAESPDGVHWSRRDEALADLPAPSDWDAHMQAYPHVVRHGARTWLLYNGDDYGRAGFGLVELT